MHKLLKLSLLIVLISGCEKNNKLKPEKVIPNTERVLNFIDSLNAAKEFSLILGQDVVPDVTSGHLTTYSDTYLGLYNSSGKHPAIIGSTIGECNHYVAGFEDWMKEKLFEHWKRGGLVNITWGVENPWTGEEPLDRTKADMIRLIDPTDSIYSTWIEKLDKTAEFLQFFADNDVPVIWRPFHEMNGNWYWWGSETNTETTEAFKNLWKFVHTYFTNKKGLDNLIWLYAPMDDSQWVNKSTDYYPGSDYVDLVGISYYGGYMNIKGYNNLLTLNKPLGIAEFGPINTADYNETNENFSAAYLLHKIKQDFPEMVFCYCFHGWKLDEWIYQDMAHYPGIDTIINSKDVISCDELLY